MGYKNGVSNQNASNTVTGTGVTPASLVFSDASPFSFGTVTIGNSSSHSFTLTNSGASTATSLAASGLSGAFAFVGGSYPGTGELAEPRSAETILHAPSW